MAFFLCFVYILTESKYYKIFSLKIGLTTILYDTLLASAYLPFSVQIQCELYGYVKTGCTESREDLLIPFHSLLKFPGVVDI